jgi:3-hydroxybutyrate dehydrogenase
MRLEGKVAIITGAASGIGRAMAQRFASEGAKVVIADHESRTQAVAAEIAAGTRGQLLGLVTDVTNEDSVEKTVAQTIREYGGVDILCSNAGNQIIGGMHELAFSDWKKIMAVHLDGAFLTTRACLRHMYSAGRGGTIIYTGSVHSKLASVLKAPYVTAKHGLIGLAKTVAKEGAKDKIRANVICPGFVRTPLVEKQIPEQAKALGISEADVIKNVMLKETVDGEFTTVQDVAQLAVFLAAFPTNALTGQSITVSHGWHMQ